MASHTSYDPRLGGEPLPAFRRWENAHILLWLSKDTCWLLGFEVPALVMAMPTLTLAVLITWLMRRNRTELMHNLAVCSWIGGNVVWMVGEFYHEDTWRPFAQWFFFAGLAILALHYGRLLVGMASVGRSA